MRYHVLFVVMIVLFVMGISPQAQEANLSFIDPGLIEVTDLDAASIHPGKVFELDAEAATCKPNACLPMQDCAGTCVTPFRRLPGDSLGAGIWAWIGSCKAGVICSPGTGGILGKDLSDNKALCMCEAPVDSCAPDYRYVGTKKRVDGSVAYLVQAVPQPEEQPGSCN